jgi:N-methylhydantoinase A/oxoprolinase/acetone carboxylase beta subunit
MDPVYRIGIDVGGTHTDAVLMRGARDILAASKRLTTDDVLSGIQQAAKDLAAEAGIGT